MNIDNYEDPRNIDELQLENIDTCFQDEYDQYVANASRIINNTENLDPSVEYTLKLGIELLEKYRYNIQELEMFKIKSTPVIPDDLEVSKLAKGFIGRCECGQLIIQTKNRFCPKCGQLILWPKLDV